MAPGMPPNFMGSPVATMSHMQMQQQVTRGVSVFSRQRSREGAREPYPCRPPITTTHHDHVLLPPAAPTRYSPPSQMAMAAGQSGHNGAMNGYSMNGNGYGPGASNGAGGGGKAGVGPAPAAPAGMFMMPRFFNMGQVRPGVSKMGPRFFKQLRRGSKLAPPHVACRPQSHPR